MTPIETLVEELRAGLEGVTPGYDRWIWLLGDRTVYTRDPNDGCRIKDIVRADVPGDNATLAHIARCSPGNIRTLLEALATSNAERDEARGIVRNIHWMANRYADGRMTYAPSMCNDAIRKAYDAGWLEHQGPDPRFALDGSSPEYLTVSARATAAEAQLEQVTKELGEIKSLSAKYMEDSGQAYCYVGIRDYAVEHETRVAAEATIETLRAAADRAVRACNSAWAAGEPPHRVKDMLDAVDALSCALSQGGGNG